jgi:hypothetical protein
MATTKQQLTDEAKMANSKSTTTCYGRVLTRRSCDEWYETATRDAGKRAKALRKLGFRVFVQGMGSQVTNVGLVNMTLVSIMHDGTNIPPEPEKLVRGV